MAMTSFHAGNCRELLRGMAAMGFQPFLAERFQAPIIVTFHAPAHPAYDFKRFYAAVRQRGFVLYPGKLTRIDTFRIGCIGAIDTTVIDAMLAAAEATLRDMTLSIQP